jgi:hypothetical protein
MIFVYRQFFSFSMADNLTSLNLTVDGNEGGLVLGNSHENGGIFMLARYSDGYRIIGEMEGYEYLVNTGATKHFNNRLLTINNSDRDKLFGFSADLFTPSSTVLDCSTDNASFKSKFILLDGRGGMSIVNKHSTLLYLSELEEMNDSVKWKWHDEYLNWNDAAIHPKNDVIENPISKIIDLFKW